MRVYLLLVLLLSLGCARESDDATSNAEETTLVSSTESSESTDDGSTESGTCDGKPDDCCVHQQHLPGECRCADPNEPCFDEYGCATADAMATCDDLCAQIGQTCVADGCAGSTAIIGTGSTPSDCPNE